MSGHNAFSELKQDWSFDRRAANEAQKARLLVEETIAGRIEDRPALGRARYRG